MSFGIQSQETSNENHLLMNYWFKGPTGCLELLSFLDTLKRSEKTVTLPLAESCSSACCVFGMVGAQQSHLTLFLQPQEAAKIWVVEQASGGTLQMAGGVCSTWWVNNTQDV